MMMIVVAVLMMITMARFGGWGDDLDDYAAIKKDVQSL
jgi:hypothetical protein